MSKRAAPDPVAVLRGHRASVTDICFHPSKPILFSGSADGELRIWDTFRRQTLSSAWLHSAAHGILALASSSSLGTNKFVSQGRDGTVKVWDFDDTGLSRIPSVTIKTNSYHFCKFSLAKNQSTGSKAGEASKDCLETEEVHTNQSCSESSEGLSYVALSGENSSEVEIWDLKSAERFARLPSSIGSNSSSVSSKGMCMALQLCVPSESQGFLNVMAGYSFDLSISLSLTRKYTLKTCCIISERDMKMELCFGGMYGILEFQ
ncbi:guanine nucleotide-binding protein beta subunit-like protein [Medicago truncatula]|uniref:Guanine nucleotide-binding protein beta subunit-like protein n=1 Tax=Medicago truncatula TaxID=3880 RepID=A0A072V4E3_MEDTR|nr:guanine nucleotide-binding protein beta subunit-like protein [Medicago truncatula]